MQQHPIPRNITGFKFKLVGDMTLKQFGYLAAGVILGYINFQILPTPKAISLVVGILFAGAGAALAFLPIHGRPLDIWIKSFIRSIYSPTQYLWHKNNPPPAILLKHAKRGGMIAPARKNISSKEVADVNQKLNNYLQKQDENIEDKLNKEEKQAIKQKEIAAKIVKKTNTPNNPPIRKTNNQAIAFTARRPKLKTSIHILDGSQKIKSGFPQIQNAPNIVSGTVVDQNKKHLPNILVAIKDEKKTTTRALKTNALGQFMLSAPLENGIYYLDVEDPKGNFAFDIIKLTLHGGKFKPIEVTAKPARQNRRQESGATIRKQDEIKQKLFNK